MWTGTSSLTPSQRPSSGINHVICDSLALIVQLPGFLLVILAPTSPIKVVLQAMRIVSALSLRQSASSDCLSLI